MNAKSAKDDEYDEELDDEYEEDEEDEEFDEDEDEEDDEDEDEGDFDDDEDFEDDEALADGEEPEEDDPYWWGPYAVLGCLLVVGLLGFFGMFNSVLGFLAAPVPVEEGTGEHAAAHETAAPAPQPQPRQAPTALPGQFYGAKHILVMYQGSRRAPAKITRSKEEAKARAMEVVKRVKKGEKFEELVKEFSDEPGAAARGGNLGKFRKGTMVPAFQAAVEKLKVGGISDPVETPFGFHVIVRTH